MAFRRPKARGMASASEQGAKAKETILAVPLTDRAAMVVRGPDRTSWLNGLITCDLAKLEPGHATYGLLVEKKGKIQTDFFVLPSAEAFALALPRDLRDAVQTTLDHYLIMEDAELEVPELVFFHLHGPRADEARTTLAAPYGGTLDLLGTGGAIVAAPPDGFVERVTAECARLGGVVGDEAGWDALRIEHGLPRFGVEFDTSLYPQEASLEKRAVSFSKGCYLGQEVVYMLENRGHVKKKLVPLDIDGTSMPAAGDKITTPDGVEVGDVKSAILGPTTGRLAAIAMVKWAQSKPGTELRIGDRVARVRA
jgi:tRNA-modifying protein YgfZ